MKRNDIGDSYLLWLVERVLATRGVHPRRRTITPPYAGKHSAQPSRMPARQPLEMPGRYRFHSTRPADFSRKANVPGATRPAFRSSCAAAWTISLRDRRACYAEAAWNI